MATESNVSAPPANDDESDTPSDPNVRIQEDLQSLLDKKQTSIYDLQKKTKKMTVDLSIERQKTKQLEKDRLSFISSCKSTAKQTVDAMNITITHLKTLAKSQEKSTAELLKAKDVKFKELNSQLQKNMKNCKKMLTTIDDLQRTVSRQSINISNLKGDIMSKMREGNIFKKENRQLSSQLSVLHQKNFEVNERKMEHALQLKKIEMET